MVRIFHESNGVLRAPYTSTTGSNTPVPDDDPLDQCNGHGTHVAVSFFRWQIERNKLSYPLRVGSLNLIQYADRTLWFDTIGHHRSQPRQ